MAQAARDTVNLHVPVSVETVAHQQVVTVDLRGVSLPIWCLNLCLLKEDLVKSFKLTGGEEMYIEKNRARRAVHRAELDLVSEPVRLTVHPGELDYWLSFFLKYYRDGIAEVDHLDVEAAIAPGRRDSAYVIFKVKEALAPVSSGEAKKRLKLG